METLRPTSDLEREYLQRRARAREIRKHMSLNSEPKRRSTRLRAKTKMPVAEHLVPKPEGSGSGSESSSAKGSESSLEIIVDKIEDIGKEDKKILYHPESDVEESSLPEVRPCGRVYETAAPFAYLGRVTQIKVGTPDEAFSIYCSRHGCAIMKKLRQYPGPQAVKQWYKDGMAIPRGRTQANKDEHRRKWPT